MVKHCSLGIVFFLALLMLAACGSGGGAGTVYTSVTLKVNLSGDLGGKAISGAGFTLTLPSNTAPATVNGVVAAGVVKPSGTFADSTITPVATYTPASGTIPGKLVIIIANSIPAGVTTVGEVATVTLQLTNGAALSAVNFVLDNVSVSVFSCT